MIIICWHSCGFFKIIPTAARQQLSFFEEITVCAANGIFFTFNTDF